MTGIVIIVMICLALDIIWLIREFLKASTTVIDDSFDKWHSDAMKVRSIKEDKEGE